MDNIKTSTSIGGSWNFKIKNSNNLLVSEG